MEPAEEQAVTAEFSGKQVASPVVTKVYSREVLRPSTRVADMAELLGDLYQGDSWNYPGMKDTQILHTTSDVSSDSPSHAKVEEQSSFKMLHIGASNGLRGAKSPTIVKVATPDRSSPTDMPSSTPDGTTVQADRHLAISNSSNSSACCMPSPVAQGAPSYDIKVSARTAELRHAGMASSEASRSHFSTAAAQHNQVPAVAQQSRYPNHVLQSMMAHAFDDVDSGRHQHDDLDSPPALSGPPMHHRRPISQQDSILPAYRSFFPSADPSSLPLQPQLFNHFQLPPEQILPPELLDRPHHAHPDQHYGSHTTQEPGQSSNFPTFPALSDPVQDVLLQMSSDMRQWPSPAGSSARQGPAFTAAQHHMEGLEITGAIKRDHASFTGPTSQSRQAKPQPRRALSFTQASASSDAPLAAAASTGGGSGGGRRGDNGSQAAASGSRLSSPGSHAATPPETDASLSDGDDASGSDTAGANTKRRKVVKGKRGAGRRPCRIVCRNCAASQTPQWRCGPDGPRTLCNACGVRYKKGLPLTGGAATNGSS